jgi:phosphate transport system protein
MIDSRKDSVQPPGMAGVELKVEGTRGGRLRRVGASWKLGFDEPSDGPSAGPRTGPLGNPAGWSRVYHPSKILMTTTQEFAARINRLRADLVEQGRRVQTMVEGGFDALFTRSSAKAAEVLKQDDVIDKVDVDLERACVSLLADATREGASIGEVELRSVLTIAKVNNELERVADVAVDVSELVAEHPSGPAFPDTFKVIANSTIGILRDTTTALQRQDVVLAKIVLQSQHNVTTFKRAIVKDSERQIGAGKMNAEFAFLLHEVANLSEIIADHCTNIAEQIIYVNTGAIVRHMEAAWVEVGKPHHQ